MNRFVVWITILPLLLPATPTAAAANLTNERLTQQCRPQMEAIIPGTISYLEAEVTEWQHSLKETPELQDRGEPIIREDQRKIASLRADGVQGAAMRDMLDPYRQAGSKNSKAELRKALGEARNAPGPDAALAACILGAVLANLEDTSQSASAATVAARNKAAIPPLRPTTVLEAHNPANEASQCLELITKRDFDAKGVKSNMGAAFRNKCSYPVETKWCIGEGSCAKLGYDNLATMPASGDRGISYDEGPKGSKTVTHWAACRTGFVYRAEFARILNYACK